MLACPFRRRFDFANLYVGCWHSRSPCLDQILPAMSDCRHSWLKRGICAAPFLRHSCQPSPGFFAAGLEGAGISADERDDLYDLMSPQSC